MCFAHDGAANILTQLIGINIEIRFRWHIFKCLCERPILLASFDCLSQTYLNIMDHYSCHVQHPISTFYFLFIYVRTTVLQIGCVLRIHKRHGSNVNTNLIIIFNHHFDSRKLNGKYKTKIAKQCSFGFSWQHNVWMARFM